jgi:Nitrogen regulatory protein PII
MSGIELICCVVNKGEASKVMRYAKKYGVKGANVSLGRGTIQNRILEFLQINETRKEFVSMIVESNLADEAIQGISKDMAFAKPNHGIAFSHSLAEIIINGDRKCCEKDTTNTSEVKKTMYNAIYVIVEKGNAEDVVEAATKAGARGATILNARGSGIENAQKFFALEIEPEKEKILIIAKVEQKNQIVEAINTHLEVETPGSGIVYVLEVNEAYGLQ